jgi:hypothetical protein
MLPLPASQGECDLFQDEQNKVKLNDLFNALKDLSEKD